MEARKFSYYLWILLMSVGLEVFNSNGVSIIDTSYPNYGLLGKWDMGGLPRATIPGAGTYQYRYLELTNRFAPVLFFNCVGLSSSVNIVTVQVTGSTFRFYFEEYRMASEGGIVTVYAFDLMSSILPNGSSKGVGIESYKPDGSLIFSSTIKPLRPVWQSKVASVRYVQSQGGYVAYAGDNGTNGHNTGGAYNDTWVVDGIPKGITIAANSSRFRYGASGSSTEYTYGDALFERIRVLNGAEPSVVLQPFGTGIGGEEFGGFLGTQLDYKYQPVITVIDVTGY